MKHKILILLVSCIATSLFGQTQDWKEVVKFESKLTLVQKQEYDALIQGKTKSFQSFIENGVKYTVFVDEHDCQFTLKLFNGHVIEEELVSLINTGL